jgi:hypothetical protein
MNLDSMHRTEEQLTVSRATVAGPQMELALAEGQAAQLVGPRRRRQGRASWWFQRMRQIVECACDWEPVLAPPPEQIWLPNTHRTITLLPGPSDEQRQLCE